jgi:hypothetical protein
MFSLQLEISKMLFIFEVQQELSFLELWFGAVNLKLK